MILIPTMMESKSKSKEDKRDFSIQDIYTKRVNMHHVRQQQHSQTNIQKSHIQILCEILAILTICSLPQKISINSQLPKCNKTKH